MSGMSGRPRGLGGLGDGKDRLELDGGVFRQAGYGHGEACGGRDQDVDQQIGGAIDDGRAVGKAGTPLTKPLS